PSACWKDSGCISIKLLIRQVLRRNKQTENLQPSAMAASFCYTGGAPPGRPVEQSKNNDGETRRSRVTMDQKILSELGDYLLAHREEIIGEWLRAIERNPEFSSPKHLDYTELVDHLPELCQELAELLKSSQPDQNRSDISRTARVHGKYRWRQGYRLEEVIRETSIVRRILFHNWVEAFAREEPQFAGETRKVAESIVHQAVDDVIADSAEQFVEEQQKSNSDLNSQLADALADVRHEKAAADAANPAKARFLAML